MIIRELFAKLGLDVDKGGFTTADVMLAAVKAGLVAVGGLAVAAAGGLSVLVSELVETSGSLNDTSQAIGVDVEALQELTFAAQLSGASMDDMRTAVTILSRHLVAAADGSKESAEAFSKLGIRVRDGEGHIRKADDVIGDVAEAFAKMPDGAKKTAAAMDLFGKSGAGLIPFLNAGRKGLAELRQEARDLGIVIDRDTVAAGDDLGDNLDRLKLAFRGLGYAISGPLLGAYNDQVKAAIDWVKANRMLIATRVGQFVRGLIAVGKVLFGVLRGIGRAIDFVADHARLLAVVLSSVLLVVLAQNAAALAGLVGRYILFGTVATAAALRSAAAWVVASAPMVAIVALIALAILLADELITHLEGGDTILGKLIPKWQKFLEEFSHGGSDAEPVWIQFLRFGAALLTDFTQTVKDAAAGWVIIFKELALWLLRPWIDMFDYIEQRLRRLTDAAKSVLGKVGLSAAPVSFGGGSSPSSSVAARGPAGATAIMQNTRNQITVQAAAGQSADEIADTVERRLDRWHQTKLEEAQAALGTG